LQVFVDHHDHLTSFIQYVIEEFSKLSEQKDGGIAERSIGTLTQINLYHRLLECYLYKQQSIETEIKNKQRDQESRVTTMPRYSLEAQTEQASSTEKIRKIKEEINNFIE